MARIPKAVRQNVWNDYIGMKHAEGKCYVCGGIIHISDFDVGHNVARAKGGTNSVSNLRPLCRPCNLSMGTNSIEQFKKKYFGGDAKLRKAPQRKTKPISEMTGKEYLKHIGKTVEETTFRQWDRYLEQSSKFGK